MSISAGAGLDLTIAIESANVLVYGNDSVYDENSDQCIHAQWYEEERRNRWKIPIGKGKVFRYDFNVETEGRQCGDYDDAKLVWKSVKSL